MSNQVNNAFLSLTNKISKTPANDLLKKVEEESKEALSLFLTNPVMQTNAAPNASDTQDAENIGGTSQQELASNINVVINTINIINESTSDDSGTREISAISDNENVPTTTQSNNANNMTPMNATQSKPKPLGNNAQDTGVLNALGSVLQDFLSFISSIFGIEDADEAEGTDDVDTEDDVNTDMDVDTEDDIDTEDDVDTDMDVDTDNDTNTNANGIVFDFEENLTPEQEYDLELFKQNWAENKDRYKYIEEQTGYPAELVAAIHWNESGCDFDTYLQNGDPLGQPTTHVPEGIYCETWEESAIKAMEDQGYPVDRNDINTYYEFAERYNGLGYRNQGLASPYVWAGTTNYTGGRYVADGVFDPDAYDEGIGVAVMLKALMTEEQS